MIRRRIFIIIACVLYGAIFQPAGIHAQTAAAETTLQSLRRDMDELIRGQIQLQQQMQELKTMLQPAQPRPQNPFPTNFIFNLDGLAFQGDTNAVITMIEFSDIECPYCAAYLTETFPWIEHDYIKTAKVRYGLLNFPLEMHPQARGAAAAVNCAGQQGRFWEMRARLIASQNNLTPETFLKTAARLGLQTNTFNECLTSAATTNGISQKMAEATRAGVTGTPTFFIGLTEPGSRQFKVQVVIVGQRPYDVFKAALDGLLNKGKPPS